MKRKRERPGVQEGQEGKAKTFPRQQGRIERELHIGESAPKKSEASSNESFITAVKD